MPEWMNFLDEVLMHKMIAETSTGSLYVKLNADTGAGNEIQLTYVMHVWLMVKSH